MGKGSSNKTKIVKCATQKRLTPIAPDADGRCLLFGDSALAAERAFILRAVDGLRAIHLFADHMVSRLTKLAADAGVAEAGVSLPKTAYIPGTDP